jgi:hypothetical protein
MELSKKIKAIKEGKKLSTKQLCDILQLNNVSFSRNVRNNNLTGDMILAFAKHIPEIDLNELIKDNYEKKTIPNRDSFLIEKIENCIKEMGEIKLELSRK